MIFGKRERSRTERTAALSFDEPKGKAHNQWRLMLMFSVGCVPPLPLTLTPTLSKTLGRGMEKEESQEKRYRKRFSG